MPKRPVRDLQVGVVFALGLAVFAIAVMAVGGESRLFAKKARYQVLFPTADGLTIGSPVKLAGVQVGSVSDIRLPKDPSSTGIEVTLGVDRDYSPRIRTDSTAALRTLQLLTGEKLVEILPGSADSDQLAEGALIAPEQKSELFEQAADTAENLNQISVSLKKILDDMSSGEGLFGQMISDPEFGREGLDALGGTLENLQQLSGDLLQGKGFMGRMLYDRDFATQIDSIAQTLDRTSQLVGELDLSKGAIGDLLSEEGRGKQMIEDLAHSATTLRGLTDRIAEGKGLVGRLMVDEAYSEKVAADLERTVANLADITDKINSGEGTLGALVNERVVHDSLEDVVTGVNDSKFARWLMRRYQKKGIKKQEETPDPQ